jgi:spermidine/putrescine-binding protein
MTTKPRGSLGIARLLSIFMGIGALFFAISFGDGRSAAAAPWEKEWKQLIAKAKAEGKLTVALGSSASRNLRHVYKAFEKKFGIKVTLGGGRGRLVTARLTSERANKVYSVDMVQIGVASTTKELLPNDFLAPIPPLFLLPEVKDPSLWLDGHHWWGDPKTKKFVLYYSLPRGDTRIAINTKLVNPDDINSWEDVFHPRYDGLRMSGPLELAESSHSVTARWMMSGKDWLRRWITEAKPAYGADSDVMINWLIEGRYGIALFLGGRAERTQLEGLQSPEGGCRCEPRIEWQFHRHQECAASQRD